MTIINPLFCDHHVCCCVRWFLLRPLVTPPDLCSAGLVTSERGAILVEAEGGIYIHMCLLFVVAFLPGAHHQGPWGGADFRRCPPSPLPIALLRRTQARHYRPTPDIIALRRIRGMNHALGPLFIRRRPRQSGVGQSGVGPANPACPCRGVPPPFPFSIIRVAVLGGSC